MLGMCANKAKTEAIIFNKTLMTAKLKMRTQETQTGDSIKVPGLQFRHDLKWTYHIEKVIKKAALITNRILYSSVYHSAPVWLGSVRCSVGWKILSTVWPDKGQHVSELKKTSPTELPPRIQNKNRPAVHRQSTGWCLQATLFWLVQNGAFETDVEDEVKEDFLPILLIR